MHGVIDIGNTRAKVAFYEGKERIHQYNFDRDGEQEIQDFLVTQPCKQGIFSSSAKLGDGLRGFLISRGFIELSSALKLPLRLYYDTPTTLGSDRLAQVVGSWSEFKHQNSLTISLGTCITYNFLSAEGLYMGGNISPGLQMRMRSMHDMTDKLPLLNVSYEASLVGNTTESAMAGGVIRGVVFELMGYITYAQQHFEESKVVVTGGDTPLFGKYFNEEIFIRPNLALDGLNEIYFLNA